MFGASVFLERVEADSHGPDDRARARDEFSPPTQCPRRAHRRFTAIAGELSFVPVLIVPADNLASEK
jgi:hypothetical protein